MRAKVVNQFKELQHEGHIYEQGDIYPADGYEADPERVEFLAQVHPEYKRVFLKVEPSTAFPKHTGGGWYELSNGEKVQGKDEAIEAENALKSGE